MSVKASFVLGILSVSVTLFACKNTQGKALAPAIIQAPSAQQTQLLETAIASLFSVKSIVIAKDAFVQKSTLMITRKVAKNSFGQPIQGRVVELPNTVNLVTDGKNCYLKHLQNNQQVLIKGLKCRPFELAN